MKKSLLSVMIVSTIALTAAMSSAMTPPPPPGADGIQKEPRPIHTQEAIHMVNSSSGTMRTGGPMLPPLGGTGTRMEHGTGTRNDREIRGTGARMENSTGSRMRPDMPPVNGCTPVAGSSTGYSLTGPCMPPPMRFQTGSQMEHGTGARLPDMPRPDDMRLGMPPDQMCTGVAMQDGTSMEHCATATGTISTVHTSTGVLVTPPKKPVPTLSPRIKALQKKVQDRKNARKGPMMQHTTTSTGSVQ